MTSTQKRSSSRPSPRSARHTRPQPNTTPARRVSRSQRVRTEELRIPLPETWREEFAATSRYP